MNTADTQFAALEQYAGSSDGQKGLPGPLELSRMHEAELKRCYKQYAVMGALIRQIMVGRRLRSDRYHSDAIEVTDIKLQDGKVQIYGKPNGRRKQKLICEGLGDLEIVP